MSTSRTRLFPALASITGLIVLGASAPAAADPLPNDTAPVCLRPSGEAEPNYANYDVGHGSLKGGALDTSFQPLAPSCPGATYTFTVSSVDGSSLGWTTSATGPAGSTAVSPDGTSATVTFTGDGQTQRFLLSGTTGKAYSKRNTCVGLSMTTTLAGASYVWSSLTGRICDEDGGAGSYYG